MLLQLHHRHAPPLPGPPSTIQHTTHRVVAAATVAMAKNEKIVKEVDVFFILLMLSRKPEMEPNVIQFNCVFVCICVRVRECVTVCNICQRAPH